MNFQNKVLMRAIEESCRTAGYRSIQFLQGNFGDMMIRAWEWQPRRPEGTRLKLLLAELGLDVRDFGGYRCDQVMACIFDSAWWQLRELGKGEEVVRRL